MKFKSLLMIISIIISATAVKIHSVELNENSVYNLDSEWINQNKESVKLKSFLGKHVLLAMVYLTCTYSCPAIISQIESIESKLNPSVKKNLALVLISIDPDHDTPEKLKEYMMKRKLSPQKWTMLTAQNENDVRELAAILSFKYKKSESGDYTHSFMIHFLNKEGVIQDVIDKINVDSKIFADKINKDNQ